MSKRDRRHKPGAKKPQHDRQMCFIQQQEKIASCALPNEVEKCNLQSGLNQWTKKIKKGKIICHT